MTRQELSQLPIGAIIRYRCEGYVVIVPGESMTLAELVANRLPLYLGNIDPNECRVVESIVAEKVKTDAIQDTVRLSAILARLSEVEPLARLKLLATFGVNDYDLEGYDLLGSEPIQIESFRAAIDKRLLKKP